MPAYDSVQFSPPAPLAHVILRYPKTGALESDVPMLLDWGADVSMVPRACLNSLGVAEPEGREFKLEAFDGTVTQNQAVQLQLQFLGGTFKGPFLLLDRQWGVLGRNILNHFVILLDGPRLTWSRPVQSS